MADYTEGDIDDIMWAGNSTPRNCLGYRTPAEAFLENLTIALEM
jgi:IS30 family transposase